jgi:DNA-binding GntR family transcriptional regulator
MPIALERKLSPVQPRTMVEQAAEAIVNAAARGVFLPGDRLVEAEIARELTISRVPVREALRLLESHGVVVATPYKGMRLAELSNDRVRQLIAVRKVLEAMAAREAKTRAVAAEDWAELRRLVDALKRAATEDDSGRVNELDVAFHTELFRMSGNTVLIGLWQSLSRQVLILCALTRTTMGPQEVARRHESLLDSLEHADPATLDAALAVHLGWLDAFDAEAALATLRKPKRGG